MKTSTITWGHVGLKSKIDMVEVKPYLDRRGTFIPKSYFPNIISNLTHVSSAHWK